MSFSESASPRLSGPAWQARALDRSLEEPRARLVDRMERLVTAARDLANESGSATFTVAQVASRARCSLKAFYRCFASKDELLLALFEDDSRLGAEVLRDRVNEQRTSEARLRAAFVGVFELLTHPGALGYANVLIREHLRLREEHSAELDAALAPLVDVLAGEIRGAAAAGALTSRDPARDARLLFALLMTGIHSVVLDHAEPLDVAEPIWRFAWAGLSRRDGEGETP